MQKSLRMGCLIVLYCISHLTYAQDPITEPATLLSDSISSGKDSSVVNDTIDIPTQKGDIETTIKYESRDSMRMDIPGQKVYLFGAAKINYGTITLEAEEIAIDWESGIISANGLPDSTGKIRGKPLFRDGSDMYVADSMKYNFKSKKGIIHGVVTQQGEGYIHGDKVKRTEEAIYIGEARYTTCNLAHPHFYISANKLKVIPEDKVVTGPFHMVVSDIHTPVGLPLGFFPITDKQKSGIIFPTFGEQQNRGFFLSQGGYYLALGDYAGVKLLGDLYTNGSYRTTLGTIYKKRYAFDGTLDINFSKLKDGFDEVKAPEQFNINWKHNTASKKNSRFNASVNASSNSYYRQNTYNPTTVQSSVFTSTVSYYKNFANSPFNMGVTVRHDQNVQTKVMNLTAPDVNLGMNRIYPFKRKIGSGNKWYEKNNLAYNGNTKYSMTNNITPLKDTLEINSDNLTTILEYGQWGAKHSVPLSTSLKILKYFSLNPNATYEETWYTKSLNYTYNATSNSIVTDTIDGFRRAYSYSAGASLTTRIYGTFRIKSKTIKGIRHTIVPTINYTYRPDFSDPKFGNYIAIDEVKNTKGEATRLSKYNGFIYGGPGNGLQNIIGFDLRNNFEAKVRNRKDTTSATKEKKVSLLDNVGLSGNYNFTADSLKLSVISATARTKLFNRIDINFTSSFDPYIYVLDSVKNNVIYQRRVDQFSINQKSGLAKLTAYNISVSTNLNPAGNKKKVAKKEQDQQVVDYINANPELYVDFNIPWSLYISYNMTYGKVGFLEKKITQSLTCNGDLKLTDKWKIGFTSGYDFVNKDLTYTTFNINRDLHCWQMSFNVVPFGTRQSFFFTFSAKSSILQDLKINKRSSTYFGQSF